ncbi:hypothetical protein [Pasteuria penetrans]|uniref:hypothetical protein n=1 Tax=Pasteuria penetrans TaxID=86005 RepID=UPI0011EF7D2E|nr:hypothetical protein [Pasteuria penetrans]
MPRQAGGIVPEEGQTGDFYGIERTFRYFCSIIHFEYFTNYYFSFFQAIWGDQDEGAREVAYAGL